VSTTALLPPRLQLEDPDRILARRSGGTDPKLRIRDLLGGQLAAAGEHRRVAREAAPEDPHRGARSAHHAREQRGPAEAPSLRHRARERSRDGRQDTDDKGEADVEWQQVVRSRVSMLRRAQQSGEHPPPEISVPGFRVVHLLGSPRS